jgi:hypothetical protein
MYITYDPLLPQPIAFMGWKHHLGFISTACRSLSGELPNDIIAQHCQGIGGTVLDLYYGKLTPATIATQILVEVCKAGAINQENYKRWVSNNGLGYRQITLSDSSIWVLRLGRYCDRYIHIHPARYSPSCLRVKPTTLKMFVAYFLQAKGQGEHPDIDRINAIRQTILQLPPLAKGVLNHHFFTLVNYVNR